MRKGKHCSLKVRSVYLLVILKMSKVIYFFNHIVMKLLLEEMLNLMKISWPASLIRRLCLLWPASHLRRLCLLWPASHLRRLCLLLFLVSSSNDDNEDENPPPPTHLPLDESFEPEQQLQLHHFLDGSVQHEKQLVILSVILQINIRHVHSSSEPLLFWLSFRDS
jgi:hypothetical protein